MQLTILDGHAVNPGDLDWKCLEQFGALTVYPRTAPEQVIERAADADALFVNKIVFNETVIEHLPRLKYIGVFATGYNLIDIAATRKRGIIVTNIPNYSTDSVAELTFAHLLNLTFHLADHTRSVLDGGWTRSPDFCYWHFPLVELKRKTFGIVGYGTIGRRVAQLAEAFGMSILAFSPSKPNGNRNGNVLMTDLDALFSQSDVVSLHCPLKPENQKLVNAEMLAKMKRQAYLINTARGGLIDEHALADALNSGHLAGAGLDVLSEEPPKETNPLLTAKNCFITPHLAWGTVAARQRLQKIAVENFQAFLDGKPVNAVK